MIFCVVSSGELCDAFWMCLPLSVVQTRQDVLPKCFAGSSSRRSLLESSKAASFIIMFSRLLLNLFVLPSPSIPFHFLYFLLLDQILSASSSSSSSSLSLSILWHVMFVCNYEAKPLLFCWSKRSRLYLR